MSFTSGIFSKSAAGIPIPYYRFVNGNGTAAKVLILGAVHGDEIEGVIAVHGLLNHFLTQFAYNLDITLVPTFNIDGVLNKTRTNANGVDLNRNLPTKDWSPVIKTLRYHPGPHANSEPENQALVNWIAKENPAWILSLHSWYPSLNVNGDCQKQADVIASYTGYRIDGMEDHPTPGCLGTYAGIERTSPVLTYEIERGLDAPKILSIHVPAILESLKTLEKNN